jgi:aspartyl-tRNA(Asn)/glutamyl-tRNA(Gln) amidotransferase subunit C
MSEFSLEHIAKLANLALDENEKKGLEKDMADILKMVENINKVDVQDESALSSVNGLSNVSRSDIVQDSLNIENVLKEAPSANAGYVKVPKVFD